MPGPSNPPGATPPLPPAFSLPFVAVRPSGDGYLTPMALQLLQGLYASIGGSGGIVDGTGLALTGPLISPGDIDIDSYALPWTPTVIGSTTAGAQTYVIQWGRYLSVGPAVLAMFNIQMKSLDGAAAGNALIGGLPLAVGAGGIQGGWMGSYTNIDMTPGLTQLGVMGTPGARVLNVFQSSPIWQRRPLTVSGLQATASFTGGFWFFR